MTKIRTKKIITKKDNMPVEQGGIGVIDISTQTDPNRSKGFELRVLAQQKPLSHGNVVSFPTPQATDQQAEKIFEQALEAEEEPIVLTEEHYATHQRLLDANPELRDIILPHQVVLEVGIPQINPYIRRSPEEALNLLRNTDGSFMAARATPENDDKPELSIYKDATFGRDGLISSLILPDSYLDDEEKVFLRDAQLQGTEEKVSNEESPGKIIHEDRPLGNHLREVIERINGWTYPYYGNADSTPLFLQLGKKLVDKRGRAFLNTGFTGKDGTVSTVNEALLRSIEFVLGEMDRHPEGLVEYKRSHKGSLAIQSWKDSWNSHSYKDGRLADPRNYIAPLEVQVYTYDALLDMAEVYRDLNPDLTNQLEDRAAKLKQVVLEKYWLEDERGGYFGMALERDRHTGELRTLDTRTSNMGHMLHSRMLEGDEPEIVRKREEVIKTLFSDEMLTVSGIRTLSSREKNFNPAAYHNGTVWLWDTYWIAEGLDNLGYHLLAQDLYTRINHAIIISGRYPEYAQGDSDLIPHFNMKQVLVYDTFYKRKDVAMQIDQQYQLWTVAAALALKEKLLKTPDNYGIVDITKRRLEKAILDARGISLPEDSLAA